MAAQVMETEDTCFIAVAQNRWVQVTPSDIVNGAIRAIVKVEELLARLTLSEVPYVKTPVE